MCETKTCLSPELLEKARLELNEDQSKVPDQIESFRRKILEDENRNFKTDDAFLLRFLRARKFDQERALELIINYYKQRAIHSDVFKKTKEELENTLNYHVTGALLQRGCQGEAVTIFFFDRWELNEVTVADLMHAYMLCLEVLIEDEAVQINGVFFLVDLEGMSMSHIAALSPALKLWLQLMTNGFPMRLKGIHYVNESPLFDTLFAIVKPLLSKKMVDRIVFHGTRSASIHEYFNPEILPEELGGDIDPFDFTESNKRVMEFAVGFSDNLSNFGFRSSEVPQIKEES